MKVLVTGGLGYIGSHTVLELIAQGHQPVIADNLANSESFILDRLKELAGVDDIPFYNIDVVQYDDLAKLFDEQKPEGVIHFAAYKAVGESVEKPLMYFRNNIGSMMTLLEVMRDKDVKNLIFSSSCTVYGDSKEQPVSEKTPEQPAASPYGYTKQACERIIKDTVQATLVQAIALRYFNPTGAHPSGRIGELPKGPPQSLTPILVSAAAGLRDELVVNGDDYDTPDGTNVRDYIHVVDLAKAHIKAIEYLEKQSKGFYDIFNVGTGKGTSVLEAIKTFEEATKVKVPHRIGPRRAGDVVTAYADTTKINTTLGWKSEKTLAEGLADAWRWQQALIKEKRI